MPVRRMVGCFVALVEGLLLSFVRTEINTMTTQRGESSPERADSTGTQRADSTATQSLGVESTGTQPQRVDSLDGSTASVLATSHS